MQRPCKQPFKASYDDQPIFEALGVIEGSPATYEAIRAWEIQLMISLQMDETQYGKLPIKERARKLCALKLPEWINALESHRMMEEMKNKRGK